MPSWTPQITELNDQIAEAYIRAEEARLKRREAIRNWMPEIGSPIAEERPATMASALPETLEAAPETASWQPLYPESIGLTPPEDWQAGLPQLPSTRPAMARPPSLVEAPPEPQRELAAWEKPAEWWQTGQKLMARGLSSVPVLPQALAAIAPAFQWIHEKVEKPIATVLTAPFRPPGVSYEEWEAPTYVKGLAEMPIWWLPWLGWASKVVKVAGVSLKAGKVVAPAVEAVGKYGTKVPLPTQEMLKTAFKTDPMRLMAKSVENVPVLNSIVKAIGGPLAFARKPKPGVPDTRLNKAMMGVGTNLSLLERWENGAKPLAMANVLQYGDARRLNRILDIKQGGIVGAAKPVKAEFLNDIDEVLKNPANYTYTTREAEQIVRTAHETLFGAFESAVGEEAVKAFRIGRVSTGEAMSKEAIENMAKAKNVTVRELREELADNLVEESLTGVRHELPQHWLKMADGRAARVQYSDNLMDYVSHNFSYYGRQVARERLQREILAIEKQGLTPRQLWAEINPLDSVKLNDLIDLTNATKYARIAANSLVVGKGTQIAGAVMGKVRQVSPNIARRIEGALVLKKDSIKYIVQALEDSIKLKPSEVQAGVKVSRIGKEFAIGRRHTLTLEQLGNVTEGALAKAFAKGKSFTPEQVGEIVRKELARVFATSDVPISLGQIGNVIRGLNFEKSIEANLVKEAYKHAFKRSAVELKAIRTELDTSLDALKAQLKPLKRSESEFLRKFAEGRQVMGEARSVIRDIPAFRGKVFDADIARLLESQYGQQGKSWARQIAQASSVGRGLIANLDLSMPFIQGLYVLSRSPLNWGKLVGKQFDFLFHPNNTAKYLIQNQAVTREMALYGSSFSTFEYVQAAGLIAKGFEKIPLAGRPIASLYKRAEAAFTGGGNVARTEMWKALKRPGMSEGELREMARTLDRMTGVMSLRELGIGRHQQDIENAWLFFAPRYTRAGLSFVNDAFTKAGITGTEAKLALGSLMAGGTAFYIGTAKALGQQPNLDPTSGRFMTLKIGDSHVGIGGMAYSLARFGANIATAIKPDDLGITAQNLLMPAVEGKINRDNPFVRFMLAKASPVTGTLVNVIEQKDFIGQPFESPADWARFAASRALPISVSQAMEPGMTPAAGAAGVFGLRAFPKSAWELRNEARNRLAMEGFGKPYSNLGKLYQHQIDENPEIKRLQAEANKQTELRGGESALWLQRDNERQSARAIYVDTLTRAQAKYDAGLMTGMEFKDLLQKAGYALGQSYRQIDAQPEYKKVIEKIGTGKATINEEGDAAYSLLAASSYGGKFDDQFGMFDYPAYQKFLEDLQRQVGPAVWDYVLAREAEHRKDLPPLAQEYYKAREVLKPYWNIQAQVERLFGKGYAESSRGQALINRQKKNLRLSNATINKYIQLFYRD